MQSGILATGLRSCARAHVQAHARARAASAGRRHARAHHACCNARAAGAAGARRGAGRRGSSSTGPCRRNEPEAGVDRAGPRNKLTRARAHGRAGPLDAATARRRRRAARAAALGRKKCARFLCRMRERYPQVCPPGGRGRPVRAHARASFRHAPRLSPPGTRPRLAAAVRRRPREKPPRDRLRGRRRGDPGPPPRSPDGRSASMRAVSPSRCAARRARCSAAAGA